MESVSLPVCRSESPFAACCRCTKVYLSCLQIWKRGTRLRIDGSWMGVDEESTSMIPDWKRGHFSLLFDGAFQPSLILLLDHEKKTWMDLHKEKKQAGKDPDSEVGTCAVCRLAALPHLGCRVAWGSALFVCKMGGDTLHMLLSRFRAG